LLQAQCEVRATRTWLDWQVPGMKKPFHIQKMMESSIIIKHEQKIYFHYFEISHTLRR